MNPIVTVLRDLAATTAKEALRRAADEWQRIETPPHQQSEGPEAAKRGRNSEPATSRTGPAAAAPDRRDPARQTASRASAETPERRMAGRSDTPLATVRPAAMPGPAAGTAQALPETAVSRIAAVDRTLASAGPSAAAQELLSVMRILPPGLAGSFLASARPSFGAIVEHLCERQPVTENGAERSNPGPTRAGGGDVAPAIGGFGSAATTRALASVAVMLDAGSGTVEVRSLARDLGAIILAGKNANDSAIFFGLAQAIAIGAGLLLPLTIAEQLDDRGERRRRQGLIAILAASIAQLGDRIARAHDDVLEIVGPLTFEWAGWRNRLDDEDLAAELYGFLRARPGLLEGMSDSLNRLERAGRDAVRILGELTKGPADESLRKACSALLASRPTHVAIAGSLTARRDVLAIAEARHPSADAVVTLEAVRLVFADIGFPLDHAAFLADAALLNQPHLPLGTGWTRLESLDAVREGGRAFQQLLAFLNGRFVVPTVVDLLDFSDVDQSRSG